MSQIIWSINIKLICVDCLKSRVKHSLSFSDGVQGVTMSAPGIMYGTCIIIIAIVPRNDMVAYSWCGLQGAGSVTGVCENSNGMNSWERAYIYAVIIAFTGENIMISLQPPSLTRSTHYHTNNNVHKSDFYISTSQHFVGYILWLLTMNGHPHTSQHCCIECVFNVISL